MKQNSGVFGWQISSEEGEKLFEISRKSTGKGLLRLLGGYGGLPRFFEWVPRNYDIENSDGEKVGDVTGHMGIRYSYDIDLADAPKNKRTLIAASLIVLLAVEW